MSSSYDIEGVIKNIRDTQTFGNNGFRKRELVIETIDQYPQTLLIEFVQNKCDILDKYSEGETVTISLNLRGREWVNPEGETKYFNSLQGWKINHKDETPTSQQYMEERQKAQQVPDDSEFEDDGEEDGLPF